MAVDMFIKIGDIKGEANDAKHPESIDVLAWSWGMSQSGTTHMGSGGGAGKVNVQDISFTKFVDASSHALIMACCTGKHYPEALITVRKAGDKPLEYIKLTMKEVMVTSVSSGGSGGEDRLTENVTLNFAEFKYEYTKQAAKGGKDATMTAAWNIAENTGEIK
ncbi:MAG: type VI secretion system tube protein Hcp [Azoarcus sp.]|nr:type VI secretion system tube protein Hcp [Azoarcus sp.]PKO60172.1 MAG: type VI secretion system tube protein Hcp [Betaproteobacteria bacterium HGW-Betaproteobacteria-19]